MRLIDADAFVEENKDIIDNNIDTNRYEVTLRELINEAPTVERPHGEWLPKYDDNGGRRYVCSICGEPCYTLLWTEPEPRDRFCLWCGADMREGEEQ